MKIGSCGTECRQGREGLGLAVGGLGGWVSRLAIVAWSKLSTQFQLVRTDPQNEGENDLVTATIMYFSVDSSWKIIWEKLSCSENRKPLSFFSKLTYLQRSRLKASTINLFSLTMAQPMHLSAGTNIVATWTPECGHKNIKIQKTEIIPRHLETPEFFLTSQRFACYFSL